MIEQIKTERLTLRPFTENDCQDLYEYLSDKETLRYEPYPPFTKEQAQDEAKRRSTDKSFIAVCLNDKVIGNLFFSKSDFDTWEIGYVFNRNFWGNGYATESCQAIIDHAFKSLNAHRIIAECNPENTASWKLMEQLGMQREGFFKQNVYFFKDENGNPVWQDTYFYAIIKDEQK